MVFLSIYFFNINIINFIINKIKRSIATLGLFKLQFLFFMLLKKKKKVTVGYGDIHAFNIKESIFSAAAMLMGSFIFAFSINAFGHII